MSNVLYIFKTAKLIWLKNFSIGKNTIKTGFIESKENIPSATVSEMGFVNAVFGFYNRQTKKFDPKTFNDVEMVSMNGSAVWQSGKPSLHLHGVVTGKDFQAHHSPNIIIRWKEFERTKRSRHLFNGCKTNHRIIMIFRSGSGDDQ